jgi:hypothetical protein
MFQRTILISLLLISLTTHAHKLSSNFVKRGTELAQELYQKCPPEKCFIINFGLTTSFASAYFRQQITDPKKRKAYYTELMVRNIGYGTESKDLLFQIFEKIIPSKKVLKGRPVVIHRTLFYGATMTAFAEYLKMFRDERRPDLKFGVFLITHNASEYYALKNTEIMSADPIWVIEDRPYSFEMQKYIQLEPNTRHPAKALFDYADTRPTSLTDLRFDIERLRQPNLQPTELKITKSCRRLVSAN